MFLNASKRSAKTLESSEVNKPVDIFCSFIRRWKFFNEHNYSNLNIIF